TAVEATNLAAAINLCTSATVTASASTNTVTVTAKTPGSTGFTGGSDTMGGFGWAGPTAGTNGVDGGTTFSYWSGNVPATTTLLATNLTAAINRGTNGSSVGVGAANSTNVVTVTAITAGAAGNSITLSTNLSNLSWSS